MKLHVKALTALAASLLVVPAMADAPAGYYKVPGTDSSLQVYGYAQLDAYDDVVQPNGVLGLSMANPNVSDASRPRNQSTLTANMSRIGIRSLTPTASGDIKTRWEIDFSGTGNGFSNPGWNGMDSNIGNPYLRQAYGEWNGFLAGKTDTNFEDPDGSPNYIDQDGLLADWYGAMRYAQLRYTTNLNKQTTLSFSAEEQSGQNAVGGTDPYTALEPTGSEAAPGATYQMNGQDIPGLTGRITYADDWGHIAFAAAFQKYVIQDNVPDVGAIKNSITSWSWALSGHFQLGKDSFVYHVGVGNGMYGAGEMDKAVFDSNGSLQVIQAKQAEFGYEHFWSEKLHSNLFASFVYYNRNADKGMTGPAFECMNQYGANVMYDASKTARFAVEYIYGYAKTFDANEILQPNGDLSGDMVHESKLHLQFKYKFF